MHAGSYNRNQRLSRQTRGKAEWGGVCLGWVKRLVCGMNVSVVVPAYNEEKLITESLRSIKLAMKAFERIGWQTELIVCNNNSTDRTAELAEAAGARVVFEPVNQIARARNRGAAAAAGKW